MWLQIRECKSALRAGRDDVAWNEQLDVIPLACSFERKPICLVLGIDSEVVAWRLEVSI